MACAWMVCRFPDEVDTFINPSGGATGLRMSARHKRSQPFLPYDDV